MTFQTTHYDQLVKLFNSFKADFYHSIYRKLSEIAAERGVLKVTRSKIEEFYEIREQLWNCLYNLRQEVEANVLYLNWEQHEIIYFNKLAAVQAEIADYLINKLRNQLIELDNMILNESIILDMEKPIPPKDVNLEVLEADEDPYQYYDETSGEYLDEYLRDKRFRKAEDLPLLIKLLESIGSAFYEAGRIYHQVVTESVVYKHHPELIQPKLVRKTDKSTQNNPSTELSAKLRWTGTNRSLYELFAQLTFIETKPGQPILNNSINELAQFLSACVEGLPKAQTVERELEKMREQEGVQNAVRGRIELHINRD